MGILNITCMYTHAVFTHVCPHLHVFICIPTVDIAKFMMLPLLPCGCSVLPYRSWAALHHAVEDKVTDKIKSRGTNG